MLKVILINPPQSTRYPQPPMGLALIAAVLERAGHQVKVLDANALRLQPENIAQQSMEADVIGLTAMTPTVGTTISIARHLKHANPKLTIILGGAHATLLPQEIMAAAPEIDVLVRGEAEETVIKLLHALESKQPLADVPGISYRHDGEVVNTARRAATADLDSLPFLAYHLLPSSKYRPHPPHGRALPFAAIITSRGCPYNCSYCSKPIFGNKFRGQSPERVVAEVAYYNENFGIKELAFYDDVFTLNKDRAHAISDGLIKKRLKLLWTCETRVNLVDRELLHHIKRAGCYSIAYGIESGSPELLNTLDKGISLAQIEEAVRLSREAGLQTIGYFMIGSPGETPQTIRQTIDFAKKLKLDFAQFSVTVPFPGTALYNLYSKNNEGTAIPWESFIYSGPGRDIMPVFESNLLKRSDIHCWIRRAYRDFYLRPSYPWQRLRQTRSLGDLRVSIKGLSMLLENMRPMHGGRR